MDSGPFLISVTAPAVAPRSLALRCGIRTLWPVATTIILFQILNAQGSPRYYPHDILTKT